MGKRRREYKRGKRCNMVRSAKQNQASVKIDRFKCKKEGNKS